jgi:hypothetical protein
VQDEQAAAAGGVEQEQSVTELPVDELTTVEQVQAALDAPGVSKTRKQKLKQRLKALQVCLFVLGTTHRAFAGFHARWMV